MPQKELTPEQEAFWREVARKSSPMAKMYPRKAPPESPNQDYSSLEARIQDAMRVYQVPREEAIRIATNPM